MKKSMKVTISLPEHVLKAAEKERKASGESRSEFFRRAVVSLLKQELESKSIEKYIQGYGDMPESAEEVEAMHRLGTGVLLQEPW
jgi:metal-responsive CopG/Arc/MetJ family transcriptional regulator